MNQPTIMKLILILASIITLVSYAQTNTNTAGPREIKLVYVDSIKMFAITGSAKGIKIRDKYFYTLSGYNPYSQEVKVVSVKPVNFKAGFSNKLNEYLGPVDFNLDIEFVPTTPRAFPSFDNLKQRREEEKEERDDLVATLVIAASPAYYASINHNMSQAGQDAIIESKAIEFRENYPTANEDFLFYDNLVKSYELLQPQIEEFNSTYTFTSNFYSKYIGLLDSILKIPPAPAKKAIDEFIKTYQGLMATNSTDDLVKKLLTRVSNLEAIYQSINQAIDNGLEIDAELQKSIMDVHKLYAQIDSRIPESINNLKGLQNIKMEIRTKEQFQKPIADASRIKILLLNKLNLKDTVLYQTIDVPTCNGWDVDFSGGIIYNSIWRQAYSLQVETDPLNAAKKIKSIIKENAFKADVAFAALLNFSYRRCNSRFGPSTGIAISFLDGNLRYLFGGHYHFGFKSAFGISAGGAFGKKTFLSDAVSDDGVNPNNPINDGYSSVPTYEKYKLGFYAGFVWNFARR